LQHNDAKTRLSEVLLKLEILVGGKEQVEARSLGSSQEFAVLQAGPRSC
jgi:hypothetical protein